MTDDITNLRDEINALREEMTTLHAIVAEIDKKSRVKNRKDYTRKIELTIMKQEFIDSKPNDRTDPLSNWELVFWASYILKGTPRQEILESTAEVAKRANRIKVVVEHFKSLSNLEDEKERDSFARQFTKDFLEYVLLEIPQYRKSNEMVPMTFYPAVSDWSINNNSAKVAQYKRDKKLDKYDTELKDDD